MPPNRASSLNQMSTVDEQGANAAETWSEDVLENMADVEAEMNRHISTIEADLQQLRRARDRRLNFQIGVEMRQSLVRYERDFYRICYSQLPTSDGSRRVDTTMSDAVSSARRHDAIEAMQTTTPEVEASSTSNNRHGFREELRSEVYLRFGNLQQDLIELRLLRDRYLQYKDHIHQDIRQLSEQINAVEADQYEDAVNPSPPYRAAVTHAHPPPEQFQSIIETDPEEDVGQMRPNLTWSDTSSEGGTRDRDVRPGAPLRGTRAPSPVPESEVQRAVRAPSPVPDTDVRRAVRAPSSTPLDEEWEEFPEALEPNNEIKTRPASEVDISGLKKKSYDWYANAKESVIDGTCRICMEKFETAEVIAEMECAHFFHQQCIEPWLRQFDACPLCRSKLATAKEQSDEESMSTMPEL